MPADSQKHLPDIGPADRLQSVCMTCGLCCDGGTYSNVDLAPTDQRAPLHAAGLDIKVRGDAAWFPQPCPAFTNRCCRIYADRPDSCRTYSCKVLTALEADQISLDEAHELIEQALSLRAKVRDEVRCIDPALTGLDLRTLTARLNSACAAAGSTAARQRYGRALVDLFALNAYIDRHFRWEETASGTEQESGASR